MFYFITTEYGHSLTGEVVAPDIECPLCKTKGLVRFAFYQPHLKSVLYLIRLPSTESTVCKTNCSACSSTIATRHWSEKMRDFCQHNKAAYHGRFSFRVTGLCALILAAVVCLMVVAIVGSQWDRHYGNGHALDRRAMEQAVEKSKPGSIFMMRKELKVIISAGNTASSVDEYRLVKIENADSSKVTVRFGKESSQDPLAPYNGWDSGQSNESFQSDRIVLLRRTVKEGYGAGYDDPAKVPAAPGTALQERTAHSNLPTWTIVRLVKD